jgi:hypothetical protein
MTSHENTLKQALMGLSKLQLPFQHDVSEKDIRETQLEENAENKINNLTDEQKKEIGEFRLGIIRNTIKRHPDVDPYETHKMMREMGY